MTFNIDSLLKSAVAKGVSDIHLKIDEAPALRLNGKIYKTQLPPLTDEDFMGILNKIVPYTYANRVFDKYDIDFSYDIPDCARFRINLSRELGRMFMVIRVIKIQIPTVKELRLPSSIEKITDFNDGIVFVTGATGSGKSTTIAALINHINITKEKHIITIEDPVEYIFTPSRSIITQRQLEIDVASYPEGVKYALRQDPDVIYIGEIRDAVTMNAALKAAETGHLVFATMHTIDAVQTINRIFGFYDPRDKDFIKTQIAETLRATISQRLVPTTEGIGRVPACEILISTPTIKDLILKEKSEDIYELLKRGNVSDMLSMNNSLYSWYKAGIISQEDTVNFSYDRQEIQQMLRGVYHGSNYGK